MTEAESILPVFQKICESRIVAVAMIDSPDHAVPLAKALMAGGVSTMEVTLRTPAALEGVRRIVAEIPAMVVGAGTVLSKSQVQDVLDAGAAFGVAPGTNRKVMKAAMECGLPFAPGITCPSDIELALEFGCRVLKFFPAEAQGGLPYLENIASPYRHLGLRYIPLGGITPENVRSYASAPDILAVGGSWLAPGELMKDGDWGTIEDLAREAVALVGGVSG